MFARALATLASTVLLLAGSGRSRPHALLPVLGLQRRLAEHVGPRGSASSFGASNSASVDPPFLPEVGAAYSASAISGHTIPVE